MMLAKCRVRLLLAVLVVVLWPAVRAKAADPIQFTQETLPNGLQVIYAPLHQAPVVHVRVLYHVGSRNERSDRQGFAHMFEHMMFRGSAHVKPEEHMRLIGIVGGYSNAFTSFDETVYVDTVPANQVELALYLEADRMASFKVSDDIFKTERKVVAEEYRMRANQPYGQVYDEMLKAAFNTHSYQWSPIGNMEHLRAASSAELQEFFNKYYVPNNAILVIAGDIDVAATQAMVKRDFAWIPRGGEVSQAVAAEPAQTAERRLELTRPVPLPMVFLGWHVPAYRSPDHPALALLATILAGGRSSRLDQLLVNGANPLAGDVSMNVERNQDPTLATIDSIVLAGKDPNTVESVILSAMAEVIDKGVTPEELDKAKIEHRVGLIRGRETAEQLATQLGEEALMGGDAGRVNSTLSDLDAVTPQDIQRVARQYFGRDNLTVLRIQPGRPAAAASQPATAPGVASSLAMPAAKDVPFPSDWPTTPPVSSTQLQAKFNKGVETTMNGVRVIVLEDHRVPIVNFSLTLRGGSYSEPMGKEGLGELTAELVRHGAGDLSYAALNKELESRAISLELGDGGDTTGLSASCTADQLDTAVARAADLLHRPTMAADEFAKLKTQTLNDLRVSLDSPTTVASRDLSEALYGHSPLGRAATPLSVEGITLDDVLAYHRSVYQPNGAILLISGDVTLERATQIAAKLLEGWAAGTPPTADYPAAATPARRRIILVDRPEGKQATIRMGIPAYDIHADEKFAGIIAGQILSSGIDSRLGKYVRAQKGLAYSVTGSFSPGRHGGAFYAGTDTAVPSTGAAIEAMFKVFNDMRTDLVTEKELAEAKTRIIGGMVMGMQTAAQQANYRAQVILNDYPSDYYDMYPAHVGTVTTEQIRDVMKQYVRDDRMVIIVVAPAAVVKEQLESLGDVEVVPMPQNRPGVTTQAADKNAAAAK